MQWLSELPLGDNRVLQIAVLASGALAVLIVLAIVYRLVFANRLRVPGGRTRQPRLGLVDAFSLDGQRQLVLIRRDNVEHLVMIGGPNDVVVESQINRALTPAREANYVAQQPHLAAAPPARRAEPLAPQAPPQSASVAPRAAPDPVAAPPRAAASVPQQPTESAARTSPPTQAEARPSRPAAEQASPPPLLSAAQAPTVSDRAYAVVAPASSITPTPPPSQPSRPLNRETTAPKSTESLRATPTPLPNPPRALPARPSMPPPIVPARPMPSSGHDKLGTATQGQSKLGEEKRFVPVGASPAKIEPLEPAKEGKVVPPAASEPQIIPAAKSVIVPPAFKPEEAREPAAGKNDPFADLDTLEAEMARLLGRDKL